eukprot:scaffold845_cov199-Alexandrium_tamarense.AAC.24
MMYRLRLYWRSDDGKTSLDDDKETEHEAMKVRHEIGIVNHTFIRRLHPHPATAADEPTQHIDSLFWYCSTSLCLEGLPWLPNGFIREHSPQPIERLGGLLSLPPPPSPNRREANGGKHLKAVIGKWNGDRERSRQRVSSLPNRLSREVASFARHRQSVSRTSAETST